MTIMPPADWDVLPSCSYPTSSLRDEPYRRPPPDAPRYDPYDFLAPEPPRPALDPLFDRYRSPFPQEVAPGVRADGVLTARHPLVAAFISALPHTSPRDGRSSGSERTPGGSGTVMLRSSSDGAAGVPGCGPPPPSAPPSPP